MEREIMKGLVNLLRTIPDPAGRSEPWIYPGWPRRGFQPPWISITKISGTEELREIQNSASVFVNLYQIDVWVNLKDSYEIGGEKYSGGKLRDYLADEVLKKIRQNRNFTENVVDSEIKSIQDFEEEEFQLLRKSITVTVKYLEVS